MERSIRGQKLLVLQHFLQQLPVTWSDTFDILGQVVNGIGERCGPQNVFISHNITLQ